MRQMAQKLTPPSAVITPNVFHQLPFPQIAIQLVSGSFDKTLITWSMETGRALATFVGHDGPIRCVKFSPTMKEIVSCSDDSTIRVWNAHTSQLITTLTGHTGAVQSISISPNGMQIASGSNDKTVCLWDWKGNLVGWNMAGHTKPVAYVTYSPDGKSVASASEDGTVRFWDARRHCPSRNYSTLHRGGSVTISPTWKYIASIKFDDQHEPAPKVCVWNLETRAFVETFDYLRHGISKAPGLPMSFSVDERFLMVGCGDNSLHGLEILSGRTVTFPSAGHKDSIMSVSVSPDGRHIASGSADTTVRLWDMSTMADPVDDEVWGMFTSFSPDGKLVVSASSSTTLRLWNSSSFSPDGRLVVSASSSTPLRLWNSSSHVRDGQVLDGQAGQMRFIAFAPDGSRIAGVSFESAIYLWDVETCRLIASSVADHISQPISISFTHGQRLVVRYSNAPLTIWEENYGEILVASGALWMESIPDGIQPPNFNLAVTRDRRRLLRGVRWFFGEANNSGVWAFLGNHIIRARENGSVTVVPVSR
ncbi:WD40-repeat-containing domain protein [Lyophyllum atratum]|nr:WD40-repeat-containing domain protein [Lyophyllum atratum]